MSWIWSNPLPEDETASPDPYTPSSFGTSSESSPNDSSEPTDAFGTAFTDDVDITPPENDSNVFDTYLNSGSGSTTDFSNAQSDPLAPLSSDSTPSINLSTLNRIDPSVISSRPSFQNSPAVDYVFADDYNEVRKKSPAEQLTFLTGSSYLFGSLTGASMGLAHAIPASAGKPLRLRLNAVLNAVAKRGTSLGNSCGVLALAFSLSETALYNYTQDETLTNYAAAGGLAGALFKSTRGVRTAGIWGAGGACLALATVYASRRGYYGRRLQGIL